MGRLPALAKNQKPIYNGVMSSTRPVRGILWLSLMPQNLALPVMPRFEVPARHLHVTLQYNIEFTPEVDSMVHLLDPVRVRLVSNCFNDRIQALRVAFDDPLDGSFTSQMCRNANPHMTISMRPGVKPVESNNMLSDPNRTERPLHESFLYLNYEFFPFN